VTKHNKTWLWLATAVLLLFCCLPCFGFPDVSQPFLALALGWLGFLYRVVPEITIDWGATLTAVFSLAGLVCGLHLFLRWLTRETQNAENTGQTFRVWQFRWTVASVAVVVLAFIAGISVVGITHQTSWLLSSPEPFLDNSFRNAIRRHQSQDNLKQQALAAHSYHDLHKLLPAGGTFDKYGQGLHGWQTALCLSSTKKSSSPKSISKNPGTTSPTRGISERRLTFSNLAEMDNSTIPAVLH
jgi:hypothetical protein